MSNYLKREFADWQKRVEALEEASKKRRAELEARSAERERQGDETMRKFVELLEQRSIDLQKCQSSIQTMICNRSKILEAVLAQPLVPGRYIYASPENRQFVTDFIPTACKTVQKAPEAIEGLETLNSSGSSSSVGAITEKMDESVYKMARDVQSMKERVNRIRKERIELDAALRMKATSMKR